MASASVTMDQAVLLFKNYLNQFQMLRYSGDTNLSKACRYSLTTPGKYIRPALTLLCAQSCQGRPELALDYALAVEMIHTYSLVHDDLPAMDDDNLRRGLPTVHKAFDQGTAILVGDTLLADAFHVLSGAEEVDSTERLRRATAVSVLAKAAGGRGLTAGQDLDLQWTGQDGYTLADLTQIHQYKTADLIAASCLLGGIAAGIERDSSHWNRLQEIGNLIGLSFQMIDDLIDDEPGTGKGRGKDQAQGKLTFRKFYLPTELREKSSDLLAQAQAEINKLPSDQKPLLAMVRALAERNV